MHGPRAGPDAQGLVPVLRGGGAVGEVVVIDAGVVGGGARAQPDGQKKHPQPTEHISSRQTTHRFSPFSNQLSYG